MCFADSCANKLRPNIETPLIEQMNRDTLCKYNLNITRYSILQITGVCACFQSGCTTLLVPSIDSHVDLNPPHTKGIFFPEEYV